MNRFTASGEGDSLDATSLRSGSSSQRRMSRINRTTGDGDALSIDDTAVSKATVLPPIPPELMAFLHPETSSNTALPPRQILPRSHAHHSLRRTANPLPSQSPHPSHRLSALIGRDTSHKSFLDISPSPSRQIPSAHPSLRRIASEESLQSAYREGAETSRERNVMQQRAHHPSHAATDASLNSRNEVKQLWKSFSKKVSERLNTSARSDARKAPSDSRHHNGRSTRDDALPPTLEDASSSPRLSLNVATRTRSNDGARLSLSLSPSSRKQSNEPKPSYSVSQTLRRMSQSSTIASDRSAALEILRSPNPATTMDSDPFTRDVGRYNKQLQRVQIAGAADNTPEGSDEDLFDQSWRREESFAQDLSLHQKRRRMTKPSSANVSRATLPGSLYDVDEAPDDLAARLYRQRSRLGDNDADSIASSNITPSEYSQDSMLPASVQGAASSVEIHTQSLGRQAANGSLASLSAAVRHKESFASLSSYSRHIVAQHKELLALSSEVQQPTQEAAETAADSSENEVATRPFAVRSKGSQSTPHTPQLRGGIDYFTGGAQQQQQSHKPATLRLKRDVETRPRCYSESHASPTIRSPKTATQTAQQSGLLDSVLHYDEKQDAATVAQPHTASSAAETASDVAAPDFVIAVVGPKNIGKTTIIERNLKQAAATRRVLLDSPAGCVTSYEGPFVIIGETKRIQILEVDMSVLHFGAEGLVWPKDLSTPDGAMLCYKHGAPDGIANLKTLLSNFWKRGNTVLITLALQAPPGVGDDKATELCNIHGSGLVLMDGGKDDPNRKAKNCVQWVVSRVKEKQAGRNGKSGKHLPSHSPRKTLGKGSHAADLVSRKSGVAAASCAAVESNDSLDDLLRRHTTQSDLYFPVNEVINKFLHARVTGNDDAFAFAFLITYRRFSRPCDVLLQLSVALANAATLLESDKTSLGVYTVSKLVITIVYMLEEYPGDFVSPKALPTLRSIQAYAMTLPTVAHCLPLEYLHELVQRCQHTTDLDAPWAIPDDASIIQEPLDPQDRRPSVVASILSEASSTLSADMTVLTSSSDTDVPLTPVTAATSSPHMISPPSAISAPSSRHTHSRRARSYSDADQLSIGYTSSTSPRTSSQYRWEGIRRQTALAELRHSALVELSQRFLGLPIDMIARHITHTSRSIFAEMQPRDLLRYVLTPRRHRVEPSTSGLDAVGKAIAFANYLSNWTATMILVQHKQRIRCKTYESFVVLASELRKVDNYDALMAILLGLNCQPVHRLSDLNDALPPDLHKRFLQLNRLMSTSRSFAAYRMALSNASPLAVPYLGVHLQDITRLNDGKSDMRDGLVNWSKMRQIASFCAVVVKIVPPQPEEAVHRRVAELTADHPVYSDDLLYDLSYTHKPRKTSSSTHGSKLRKFLAETVLNQPE